MLNAIKRKKQGVLTMTAAIGLLIAMFLLAALVDLMIMGNRYMSLHDTTKELARTIAVQGGSLTTKPEGYPNNYYDTVMLSKLVDNSMKIGGFRDQDYKVTITYTKYETDPGTGRVTNDYSYKRTFIDYTGGAQVITPTDKIDYLNDFTVTIEAQYNWAFSKYIFGQRPAYLKASAPGVSEWKYDYDRWDSET